MTLKHVQCAIDGLCGWEELIKEALEFCNVHKTSSPLFCQWALYANGQDPKVVLTSVGADYMKERVSTAPGSFPLA